jgi:hypothetical protein
MSIARNLVRFVAAPALIGGAALGLAGMANAATLDQSTGNNFGPHTTAAPAPNATPGWHYHHGIYKVQSLQTQR